MAINLKFNVLGIPLKEEYINQILDLCDESFSNDREWLCSFFNLKPEELYLALLKRYIESCEKITHIRAGSVQENIHTQLINTLASAKRCYSFGEYLACIELSALHGEMLANYLCITSKDILNDVIDTMGEKDSEHIRNTKDKHAIYISNELMQPVRIRWLLKGAVIDNDDKVALNEVHQLRIKYFHRWSTKSHKGKEDALNALGKITRVSSKFLELMGDSPQHTNVNNVKRIRDYMDLIGDS